MVIFIIFLFGFFINIVFDTGADNVLKALLAFPTGISLYVLSGFFLLVFDLGFTAGRIIFLMILTALLLSGVRFLFVRKSLGTGQGERMICAVFKDISLKYILIVSSAALLTALIATLGLFSVSISNDSYYYFNLYSKALCRFGILKREYNVFLTDVGLGAVMIGTLPHFFGFNESFGILTFFNLDFIAFFFYEAFGYVRERTGKVSTSLIASFTATLFLLSSMPFIIASKWVMANIYFMEYMFICVSLAPRLIRDGRGNGERAENKDMIIFSILFIMLSLLRMEGTMISVFLVLVFSTLRFDNRQLALAFVPAVCFQTLYDIRIFILMDINAPYTFLTERKAVLQGLMMLFVLVYLLFIRGKIRFTDSNMGGLIIAGLAAVNVILFIYDRGLYLSNLKVFYENLTDRGGWGAFPVSVIGILLMILTVGFYEKRRISLNYFDLVTLGYVILSVAVSFARGSVLQKSVGDSGNRVLLQAVPLIVYTLYIHISDLAVSKEVISESK